MTTGPVARVSAQRAWWRKPVAAAAPALAAQAAWTARIARVARVALAGSIATFFMLAGCGGGEPLVHEVQVVAGDLDSIEAEAVLREVIGSGRYGDALLVGSVEHVVSSDGDGAAQVFTWKARFEDGELQRCIGTRTRSGGGVRCQPGTDELVSMSISGLAGRDRIDVMLAVVMAPAGAVAFEIELGGDELIRAGIVNGASIATWADTRPPIEARVVDVDGNVLHVERFADMPRPPDLPVPDDMPLPGRIEFEDW